MNRWLKMRGFPRNKMVEVCGDSGYVIHRWFIINAIFENGDWRDAMGTRLSECGWVPLYWRRPSRFPKKDPED